MSIEKETDNYALDRKILQDAWSEVRTNYMEGWLNSERALQSVLYMALRKRLQPQHLVLVEPFLRGERDVRPDLVILDKEQGQIQAVIEIKYSPNWFPSSRPGDLNKLQMFGKMAGTMLEIDLFGPGRVFDHESQSWDGGRPCYKMSENVLLVMADIAHKRSLTLQRESISHPAIKMPGFVLLYGEVDPQKGEANFSIQ